ncbi:MAG: hypothetical protein NC094_02750 [Bacteroidales bacterium]|nr:hypothetical protein [Lachnoclostridium sp.]MCM1383469.1 hypothetical protein [Lachnoclostridium sp.]MCM1464318.1 hypothetical protein [Bacteroidales bacterium]
MKAKAWLVLAVAVLCMACVTGCSGSKSGQTDDDIVKEITAKALEEKYGEDFVVHKVYEVTKDTYRTVCSPQNRSDIVFETKITRWQKDGEEKGRIDSNTCGNGAVAAQISRQMEEELQEIFPGCYVHTVVFGGNGDRFDHTDCTLEEYMQSYTDKELDPMEWMHVLIQIHIRAGENKEAALEAEYQYFAERMQKEVAEESFPPATIWIYSMNEETKEWCRKYFQENYQGRQDYYDKLEESKKICLKLYCGDEFSKTYEEYAALRKGER